MSVPTMETTPRHVKMVVKHTFLDYATESESLALLRRKSDSALMCVSLSEVLLSEWEEASTICLTEDENEHEAESVTQSSSFQTDDNDEANSSAVYLADDECDDSPSPLFADARSEDFGGNKSVFVQTSGLQMGHQSSTVMSVPSMEATPRHIKMVVKNTFLDLKDATESESLALLRRGRRAKTDSALMCGSLSEVLLSEWDEASTICPTEEESPREAESMTQSSSFGTNYDDEANSNAVYLTDDECDDAPSSLFADVSCEDVGGDKQPSITNVPHMYRQSAFAPYWRGGCDHAAALIPFTSPLDSTAQCTGTDIDTELQSNTTVMVRNLPLDLSQAALVQEFYEAGYKGLIDFVYMPMNFRANGNFGYAFMNFISPEVAAYVMAQMQTSEASGSQTWFFVWSSCQGFQANVERYRNSPLMHESVPMDCKPATYGRDGNRAVFPLPSKTILKPRVHWSEEHVRSQAAKGARSKPGRRQDKPRSQTF